MDRLQTLQLHLIYQRFGTFIRFNSAPPETVSSNSPVLEAYF